MTIFIPLFASAAGLVGGGAVVAAAYSRHTARRVERNLPPDGSFATIRGRRIHYRDIGQGPAIVMIHGLAGQMRNFAAVAGRLQSSHRVVLIDRPGSGHSPGRGDDSLTDQAAIVADLIDTLGLDRPLVVGHSLGGAVSMALALNYPDKISGLALIAPLTQVQEKVPAAFRGLVIGKPAVRAIIANTLAIPMMRLNSAKSRAVLFAPEPVHPAFDLDYGGAMLARPHAVYASSSELVAVNDALAPLVARYGEIALPVRILFGEGDQILPAVVHGTRTASEIRGALCTLLPDAGHMLPVTLPARVAGFVADARAAA